MELKNNECKICQGVNIECDEEKIYQQLKAILNKASWAQGSYALLRCVKEASIPRNPPEKQKGYYHDAINHLNGVMKQVKEHEQEEFEKWWKEENEKREKMKDACPKCGIKMEKIPTPQGKGFRCGQCNGLYY